MTWQDGNFGSSAVYRDLIFEGIPDGEIINRTKKYLEALPGFQFHRIDSSGTVLEFDDLRLKFDKYESDYFFTPLIRISVRDGIVRYEFAYVYYISSKRACDEGQLHELFGYMSVGYAEKIRTELMNEFRRLSDDYRTIVTSAVKN